MGSKERDHKKRKIGDWERQRNVTNTCVKYTLKHRYVKTKITRVLRNVGLIKCKFLRINLFYKRKKIKIKILWYLQTLLIGRVSSKKSPVIVE